MRVFRFENQNYDRLRSSCLSSGKLFEDPVFKPDASSLFKSRRLDVEWKRPHELCQNPQLVVDGTNSHDVLQGQLGNCWFVAASSTLAANKADWDRVIPDIKKQERNDKNKYAGIYKFRFWQFGDWVEVVVDDLLPTSNGKLIFTHSSTKNEFWSSLLEKAYAKINGCYEHLDGGSLSEALQDFTGGVCETLKLNKANGRNKKTNNHDSHFETLKKAHDRSSLITAAINIQHRSQMEEKMECGLIKGHAYSVTKLNKMTISGNKFFSFISSSNDEKLYMIRLRNPWGTKEWNGNWSDGSDSWNKVPQKERDRMGLNYEDDGEFWMEFNDFLYYFDEISICRIINTSVLSIRKTWAESTLFSKWSLPTRAGGCVNYRDTFCDNPQFLFEINHDDDKPDEVLINLDQLSRRADGKPNLTIGFFIMKVEDNRVYRLHDIQQKVASSTFVNSRSIFLRQKMTNGRYIIIPSTFEPNIEGKFMLRVYSDETNNLKELTEDCPTPLCFRFNPFAKYASCVTSLNVKAASKLQNVDGKGSFDSYLKIICEGKTVTGRPIKSSLNPEWETTAVFYRHKQNKPIIVEIWIKKTFKDELYGSVSLDAEPNNKHMMLQSSLNKLSGDARKSGTVTIEVKSMTNIKSI